MDYEPPHNGRVTTITRYKQPPPIPAVAGVCTHIRTRRLHRWWMFWRPRWEHVFYYTY